MVALLGGLPAGTQFHIFHDQFVVLDKDDAGRVLALRSHNWGTAEFDVGGGNNLRDASIREVLENYWLKLRNGGATVSACPKMSVDLQATDGTGEYHQLVDAHASLLTLRQYGKYQHIIPAVDGIWWLATPVKTPSQKGGDAISTWCVKADGGIMICHCASERGVRPLVLMSPNVLVDKI